MLEGVSGETIASQNLLFHERALPDLDRNIRRGNSLVGTDFYSRPEAADLADEDFHQIAPFDWHEEFPWLGEAGGFDAVVGNPPYVRVGNVEERLRPYLYERYDINHRFDIYVVFVERTLSLLAAGGRIGFIVPNKFFTADYGTNLRDSLAGRRAVREIVDFGDSQVFAVATTYTCLLFLGREEQETLLYNEAATGRLASAFAVTRSFDVPARRLTGEPWAFVGREAGGLLARLKRLPRLDHLSDFQRGLETGMDTVFPLIRVSELPGRGVVVVRSDATPEPFEIETGAIRRVVKGAVDLRRYFIENHDRFVLFPYESADDGPAALIGREAMAARFPLAWGYLLGHAKALRA